VLASPPPPHLVHRRAQASHTTALRAVTTRKSAPVGLAVLARPLGQAELKAVGREPAHHCAADFEIIFFSLIIPEIGASF
jgi:hypothetical protein